MKLIAIVVAYNPNYTELRQNIYSYCHGVDSLIIWNNTPNLSNEDFERLLSLTENTNNIKIVGEGANKMIAHPINRIIEQGIKDGYTHILTMDQDSRFDDGAINEYCNLITSFNSDIYGVNICSNNKLNSIEKRPIPAQSVITSGSIYKLEIFKKIGLLREDYAIDAVDIEICFRATMHNYSIHILPQIKLLHIFGEPIKSSWGFKTNNYSAFRRYQVSRNYIWLWREYPNLFKDQKRFFIRFIFHGTIKLLLSEHNKIEKLKAMMRGINDGLRSHTKGGF